MKVLIRADSSSVLGVGHVMRCLTLAQQLVVAGAEVTFACRDLPGNLFSRVLNQGFLLIRLSGRYPEETSAFLPLNWHADFCELHSQLGSDITYDCLIVDHYGLDWRWERAMRQHARCIVVIDDLCNRRHDADFLLDQNLSATTEAYQAWLVPNCQQLLGPKFALLRPEFAGNAVTIKNKVERIVVNFGGADPTREMFKVMDALQNCADYAIDFIAGPSNPAVAELAARVVGHGNWHLHTHVDDFAALLRQADLFIGAAGSTSWERAAVGLPSIVITVAQNQIGIAESLAEYGASVYLGHYDVVNFIDVADALNFLAKNYNLRKSLSLKSTYLVDGHGTERVACEILSRVKNQSSDNKITVLCTDQSHPILPILSSWCAQNSASLLHDKNQLTGGDFLFLISCQQLLKRTEIEKYKYVLVLHASDLPMGRGMSPHVWQILNGCNEFKVSLLNAEDSVDTGDIWHQVQVDLEGHELFDEINEKLFEAELYLMDWALRCCATTNPRKQMGKSSYYPRRRPDDSQIDPERSISDQFDLLRVADYERYPAFFYFRNARYKIKICKEKMLK